MSATVLVDVAGGPMGGAARYRTEVYRHLARTGRSDVKIIGTERRVDPAWLLRREAARPTQGRGLPSTMSASSGRAATDGLSLLIPGTS